MEPIILKPTSSDVFWLLDVSPKIHIDSPPEVMTISMDDPRTQSTVFSTSQLLQEVLDQGKFQVKIHRGSVSLSQPIQVFLTFKLKFEG